VGVKLALAAVLCALATAPSAFAQKSTEDGLRDCEKLAAVKFKQENAAFKKFAIARADVEEDKFADKLGTQLISTVCHGKAVYQAASCPRSSALAHPNLTIALPRSQTAAGAFTRD